MFKVRKCTIFHTRASSIAFVALGVVFGNVERLVDAATTHSPFAICRVQCWWDVRMPAPDGETIEAY